MSNDKTISMNAIITVHKDKMIFEQNNIQIELDGW